MNLEISFVTEKEVELLYEFLSNQPFEYRKDFHPFQDESIEHLHLLMSQNTKDRYYKICLNKIWVAFYMLRGWQEGFDRPSFGLLVGHQYANKGLGKLCLQAALTECRLLEIQEIMLKVSPNNNYANQIYRKAGFEFYSLCENTGHHILVKQLA